MPRKKEVVNGNFIRYDALVLGSGPAGEGAAMKLAKAGKRVAIVDIREQMGGNCTHVGTIPSKALRQTVSSIIRYQRDPMFQKVGEWKKFTMKQVLSNAHRVIQQQVSTHTRFYDRNNIDVFNGRAYIQDQNTVLVFTPEGIKETIIFDQLVIATGSRPYQPKGLDFNHKRVFDSDKILDLDYTIHKIIIYGAGVIGCEYASIFIGLNHKVDLINTQHKLLSYLDDEIADALSYHLREQGVLIRHNEQIDYLETHDDYVVLHLQSGKKIKADAILWCNGRSGNTDGLGLENVGLKPNGRGQLAVNEKYQTEVENIYAAGDVVGWPSLASAAYDQGRCAGANMSGEENVKPVTDIPTGIYTIPEISCFGKTEQELTEEKIPYEVGQSSFRHLARAQITGDTVGELKILFHRDSLEILGIHCFGNNASEIIHIGQAVMQSPNNTLKYFMETTFNYPTMAEAYRVAALNGLNRLF
ncbi:Si-specific NAD(P)(+) transhydrogenase [Acinetobacter sp. ACZLY 512]|uniref:Si-specific NAD(P)(+) transhydrogenase n=1 Tax=Acinetobacter sp. ACZLY 512 TaxID=2911206 RepID=UPI002026C54A|nr:Si-specific NAD(P)(+) transhydrogenase [Acinetobacter sp. ACZLY 512]MCL9674648.1 Si-specific NAD(P)(+) transhydrogenase [Acinetobacter sp. ACZLY 512]